MTARTERRRNARRPVSKPTKLRCTQTGKYMAGRTRNVSASGAMLEVYLPSMLITGQRLEVGIAWQHHQALIGADELSKATVVRSLGLGGVQHVAIQFDEPVALAASA